MRRERQDLREFIDDLKSRVDIVSAISPYVRLSTRGKTAKGLCPFHQEKTPSFTVNAERRYYHCFGCGEHGDVLKFLQKLRFGDDFMETLRTVGKEHGMELPSRGEKTDRYREHHEALEAAAEFYAKLLEENTEAQDYLKGRGLSEETIRRFEIGFVPDEWNPLRKLFGKRYSDQIIREVGLVRVSEKGTEYDVFRGRIMFPIRDMAGNIRGFAGRTVVDDDAKYLNSPEGRLFSKRWLLYGLHQSLGSIKKKRRVLVVEGYMDVVMLAEKGMGEAVATMGTAATAEQMELASRHADSVVFCFDGDRAGKQAAVRALENVLPSMRDGKEGSFLFLPEGEDPDSFVQKHGPGKLTELSASATPLSEFLAEQAGGAAKAEGSDARTSSYLRDVTQMIERIDRRRAPFLRETAYAKLAERTGIPSSGLQQAAREARADQAERRADRSPPRLDRDGPIYRLLACLNFEPGLVHEVEEIPILGERREVELFHDLCDWIGRADPQPLALADHLEELGYRRLSARLKGSAVRYGSEDMDARSEFDEIGNKFRSLSSKGREKEALRERLKRELSGP